MARAKKRARGPSTGSVLDPHRAGAGTPAVYPAREDTELLRPFAAEPGRGRLLDIGTGNGELSLAAARAGWAVVATDRNPTALARLAEVARAEDLPVDVVRADLAEGLGRFERILANPPYLPTTPEERDPDPWVNLALDGGPDGLATTRRVVDGLRAHLTDEGQAFVLFSSLAPALASERLLARWRRSGGEVVEVAHRDLEGERLAVWRFTRSVRRDGARRRGTARRRPVPRPRRGASSRRPARGRSSAPGAASGRRRSPRGS